MTSEATAVVPEAGGLGGPPRTPSTALNTDDLNTAETPLSSLDQSREELYTPVRTNNNHAKGVQSLLNMNGSRVSFGSSSGSGVGSVGSAHAGNLHNKENTTNNYSSSKLVEKCLTDLTEIIERRKRELHMIQNSAHRSGGLRKQSRLGVSCSHPVIQ